MQAIVTDIQGNISRELPLAFIDPLLEPYRQIEGSDAPEEMQCRANKTVAKGRETLL